MEATVYPSAIKARIEKLRLASNIESRESVAANTPIAEKQPVPDLSDICIAASTAIERVREAWDAYNAEVNQLQRLCVPDTLAHH